MRGFLAVIASIMIMPTAAPAADFPLKAPKRAIAINDWSGFYVGGHGGYEWRSINVANRVNVPTGTVVGPPYHASDPEGAFGGIQVGYRSVITPKLVLGAEVDLSIGRIQSSWFAPGGTAARFGSNIQWFSTARGVAGYVLGNALLYGTGGLSLINADRKREQLFGTTNFATPGTVETATWIKTGWTLGGGLESALTAHWSVKFEYLYVASFTDISWVHPISLQLSDITLRMQTLKLGANYKF